MDSCFYGINCLSFIGSPASIPKMLIMTINYNRIVSITETLHGLPWNTLEFTRNNLYITL